jgi:transcriptional regulator with XRE-family HTH domain
MTEARVDVEALVAALDAQRKAKGLSWRKLALEVGIQPSTLTRMNQGKNPDVNTFTKLVDWLGMLAEDFVVRGTGAAKPSPEPVAVVSTLLRGKKDISPGAMKALQELVDAAYRLAKETKIK